ncbi:MAG TPA: biotin--[acetyl-CoA-carboxylase] ligase [Chitinophagaceae bacterium]|nr:biotin--[acetyl-CoA-carboxylase] ligase [Chitinophagaceae bacterium]
MQLPSAANPKRLPFIELQSVDSTNKYAMNLLRAASLPDRQDIALHGLSVFSHEQTSGKGQRGKQWSSEKGSNIALSIIINPFPLTLSEQFRLSVCAAVSVHEFFSALAGEETKIKWPNDLYWRDRKAGGVLIENVIGEQNSETGSRKPELWKWAIIGVGININQTIFPVDLPNPVSLKQITGKDFVPVDLAKKLCSIFFSNFQLLVDGKFEQLFYQYQTHLYKKEMTVKLKKSNRVFEATIKGVSQTGQLITQHTEEERFDFGEVEWVIQPNEPKK